MIPSIPGFGLSGPTSDAGWTHRRVARAFAELMSRLGHGTYRAQGGDVGAQVSPDLGRVDPDRVVGVHVNAARVERMLALARRQLPRAVAPAAALDTGGRH